jgi:Integrase core domain
MDARDKRLPVLRSGGRYVVELYNTVRPHSSLGYLTPEEFAASWRAAHPQQEPDPVPRPATGRVAAVHGASAPRPVAGMPTAGQTENRLNL